MNGETKKRESCKYILCLIHNHELTTKEIDILLGYKDYFSCENFNKHILSNIVNNSISNEEHVNEILRLYFSITHRFDSSYFINLNLSLQDHDITIFNGIIQLFLYKFKKHPSIELALISIKLFCVFPKKEYYDSGFYEPLYFAFNYYNSFIKTLDRFDNPIDIKTILESIKEVCNLTSNKNIRENETIKYLLGIHEILYEINRIFRVCKYDEFYLSKFLKDINIEEELTYKRKNNQSLLDNTKIIPIKMKAEILRIQNDNIQKINIQDSFFRTLFEGVQVPYLYIHVKREYLYEETLKILQNIDTNDLKKQLKIKFNDEPGVDSGGIKKEYFQLISECITNDKELFITQNNSLWVRKGANLKKIRAIGIILGIALYNNAILSIPLNVLIFKKLLNFELDIEDLSFIEPEQATSLSNLTKSVNELNDESIDKFFKEMDLKYTIIFDKKEYKLSNKHKVVTKENYSEFIKLYSHFYTIQAINEEFEQLLDGFYSVINVEFIKDFHYEELESILVGIKEIDFNKIRENCLYQGFDGSSQIIEMFWEIVESYNQVKKSELLKFVTGNDRLPIGGEESLKFTVIHNGCDTNRLPSAQTCFNSLLIPEYSSKEKLKEKLDKALSMTVGFYLL